MSGILTTHTVITQPSLFPNLRRSDFILFLFAIAGHASCIGNIWVCVVCWTISSVSPKLYKLLPAVDLLTVPHGLDEGIDAYGIDEGSHERIDDTIDDIVDDDGFDDGKETDKEGQMDLQSDEPTDHSKE